jgi:hypothetical protein
MTPAQCRGARAMLGWSQKQLGDKAGVKTHMPAYYYEKHGYERRDTGAYSGAKYVSDETLAMMKKAMEDAGIEFIGNTGLNMRTGPREQLEK